MKRIPQLLVALLICVAGAAEPPSNPGRDKKLPNIVFILTDDMGWGDVSVSGGKQGDTPNLDRLAREGTRFDQFYVASPICSPSRAAFATGLFPGRVRLNSFLQQRSGNRQCDQNDWLDPKWPTLARSLRLAGYATAHFGKWHLGGGRDVQDAPTPTAYGFDEFHLNCEGIGPRFENFGDAKTPTPNSEDGEKYFRYDFTKYWVDRGIDFIMRHKDGPFYLELWPQDVHTPHTPDGKSLGRTATPGLPPNQHNFRAVLNEYDRQIGRFLDALRKLGLEKDTIIVFSSDNGPDPSFGHARTLGLRGMKKSLYEGGVREPFFVRWPGKIPAGKVNSSTVLAAVDYFPTVCALAGVKPPEGASFDGADMSRVWLGSDEARSKPLFWEYGRKPKGYIYPEDPRDKSPNVAVREGNWKLLVQADGSGTELYDLSTDPNETKNVAGDHPETTARLSAAAIKWRKSLP